MQIVIRPAQDTFPGAVGPNSGKAGDSRAGVVVVHVDGEIDLYTGPRLRSALSDLLDLPLGGWEAERARQQ